MKSVADESGVSGKRRSVRTPTLAISCEESGPAHGEPVILVHGWPDSVRTWDGVVPSLAAAGRRVLAPELRGFGDTRFLDAATPRGAQATALACDVVELADAAGLDRFDLVGHDWGAFAAYLVAAIWPRRVRRLVALSVAYGINRPDSVPAHAQASAFWYQWLLQTPQGERMLAEDRDGFCRYIWETWMPAATIDEDAFAAAARAWENPDWAAVTLHYYRHRWGNVAGDPRYAALEAHRLSPPCITVPARLLHGAQDPCILPATTEGREGLFGGGYERRLLAVVGHFPQREQPEAVVEAILDW
ncbi:MAG: alpha/beta hydrolase [Gammaproteobacteria bacterium]|nr:alpha/beta hydrolase [Gammaproteobacteria bacterium]